MSTRVVPQPPAAQGEWTPDQILEHYLADKSYFQQTILSLKVATRSVWNKQLDANGPFETREKLKNFW